MKFKHKFKRVYFYSRYKFKYPPENYCILGIALHYYSIDMYEFRLCFFGIELRFVIFREII